MTVEGDKLYCPRCERNVTAVAAQTFTPSQRSECPAEYELVCPICFTREDELEEARAEEEE